MPAAHSHAGCAFACVKGLRMRPLVAGVIVAPAPCHRTANSQRQQLRSTCFFPAPHTHAECGDGKTRNAHMRATGRTQRCNTHSGELPYAKFSSYSSSRLPTASSRHMTHTALHCRFVHARRMPAPPPASAPAAARCQQVVGWMHESALHPAARPHAAAQAPAAYPPTHLPTYLGQQARYASNTVWRRGVPGTCTHRQPSPP